jgi:hypothetical protein
VRVDVQETVVLQQDGLVPSQGRSDIDALLGLEHDPVKAGVDRTVLVEGAAVLGDDVEVAAERAECTAMDAVTVGHAVDLWPRRMNGMVNHVGGTVQQATVAALDDVALVVDPDEI